MAIPPQHPIRLALANAASEPRTIEELERDCTELDQKIRESANTSRQCMEFGREKKRLERAILDKKIASWFKNGYLHLVSEFRRGEWRIGVSPYSGRKKARQEMRRAKAWFSKKGILNFEELWALNKESFYKAIKVNVNFDLNTDVVRARSEDEKTETCRAGCTK